ncbi:MAG: hypothetical protein MSH66_03360 [Bacteroidales bacterium]|nr:hypothetical protein [Bacteroidales bacterium]
MRKIYFIFSAFLLAMMTSCSSGVGPKEITPTSTVFTSGELAKFIEVVDQPSELTYAEKDGAIGTQYIRLKVTLKMTKDGFKNVDARDINFTSLLSVAIINLVDENGTTIQDLSVKSEDMLKLKKLLTGSEGDSEEIVFEGEYHNSDDAPKWFEQASQFTPYLTGDISVEGASSDEEESSKTIETSEETSSFELSNVLLPSQLKGKVEVINAEKSVGSYGYPSMEITFKLLSTVNTSSMCSEYGQMWIVGVGQTENGVDVKELLPNYREWRSGDSDGNEFKKFLESEPDETITLEFTGSKESSNDVESDLEKVKKFKLKITN